MRIVFGSILALMLTAAGGQAQVINGEGTFESNRGFDRAPGETTADKPAAPADRDTKPDTRKQP